MNSERLQYLKLNKNIFIAFIVSMTVSALGANYFSDQIELLNSTITLMIDHSVYYAVFGTLFYLDNKKKYILENGKINKLLLKSDLLKIVLSFGSSEIIYSIVRWGVQYELLILNYDSYIASVISHILAAIVFFVVINLGVNFTKLFKNKNKPVFASNFSIPTNKELDKKLIIGSIFFGAGWGLIGLCPGPAITSIALLNMSSAIFVVSMFTGFYIASKVN